MTKNVKYIQPFSRTAMAKFLSRRIEALAGEKTQEDIGHELGYQKGNIISMFKRGEAKVPLDKIPALASALRVDVAFLMRLGLEQYWPERMDVINKVFDKIITENEMELIKLWRKAVGDADPQITLKLRTKLKAVFTEI